MSMIATTATTAMIARTDLGALCSLAMTDREIFGAVALGLLGLGVGIWFTRVFWMDRISGRPKPLFERVMAGVAFLLTGSIPAAIEAFTKDGGSFTTSMFGLVAGAGLGLVLGYFMREGNSARDMFSDALSLRVRTGGGQPTPLEVFAFGMSLGAGRAKEMLDLDDREYEQKFTAGTNLLADSFTNSTEVERAAILAALTGVPVSQVARDWGMTPGQVAGLLAHVL